MLRIRLTLCAVLLSVGVSHAGIENAGTTAASFLSVGTGTAVLSMGGATLGAGSDLAASAWNPAALGTLNGSQFALSHATLAMQTSQDWIAGAGRVGRDATRWSGSLLYQSDGGFDGRDALGAPTPSFSVSNMAAGLHAARPFGNVVAGAGFQWVSEHLGDTSGSGLGFDAGLKTQAGAFGFGAAARNVGGKMKYSSGSYELPSVFGVGASWSHAPSGVRLALDANFPKAYYKDVRMGAEWMWQNRVALRTGYRLELGAPSGEPLGGPSFGMGAGANNLWVDYAFLAGNADAQGQHRVGLTYRPGFMNRGPEPVSQGATPKQGVHNALAGPGQLPAAPAAKPAVVTKPAPLSAPRPVPVRVVEPPPVSPVRFELPPEAVAASVAPRPSRAESNSLAPSSPVRVPRLVAAEVAPVALVKPATVEVAKAAPVAIVPAPLVMAPVAILKAPPVTAPAAIVKAPTATAPAAIAKDPPVVIARPEQKPAAPLAVVPAPAVSEPEPDAPSMPSAPPIAEIASTRPSIEIVVHSSPKPAPAAAPEPAQARPATVVVKSGETLAVLAKRWGVSPAAIMMENNLVKESVKPGQKLKLPKR